MDLSSQNQGFPYIVNIVQAVDLFLRDGSNEKYRSKLVTTFYRYVVPRYGFSHFEETGSKRISPDIKQKLTSFLQKLDVNLVHEFIELFESSTKNLDSDCSTYKSALNQFVTFCVERNYPNLSPEPPETDETGKVVVRRLKSKKPPKGKVKKYKEAYKLMSRQQKPGSRETELIYPNDYLNENLKQDIKELKENWVKVGFKEGTIKGYEGNLLRFLGWLHRFKKVPLEDLRVTCVIHSYPLTYKRDTKESYEEAINNQIRTTFEAKEKASKNIEIVIDYIDFIEGQSNSKTHLKEQLKFLISVGRFVFKDEIKKSSFIESEDDVPILKKIKTVNKGIKRDKKPIHSYSKKTIPWDTVLDVAEDLRIRSKATHTMEDDASLAPIFDFERYVNLQRFLAVFLSIVHPTDRNQVYSKLEIGKTFKLGEYKNGLFTPKKAMINPSQARWYFHLEDYKTEATYGEYWSPPLPDVKFADGSRLYEYIDLWLSKGRNYRENRTERQATCEHNYFFRGTNSMHPFSSSGWGEFLKSIFLMYTGVPVTTNCLRHMHVTEERRLGASYEELQASAYMRHHKLETANSIYNEQSLHEKIQPARTLIPKILRLEDKSI